MIWIILFFALTAFVALKSLYQPAIAVALVICMFAIEPLLQSRTVWFIENGTIVNYAIGVVVLIATLASLLKRGFSLNDITTVQWLTWLLFGYGFISFLWTSSPENFFRWRKAIPYMGMYFVLCPLITRDRDALKVAFRWVLIIGVPIVVYSVFFTEWGMRGMILAAPIIDGKRKITQTLPLGLASTASAIAIVGLFSYFGRIQGKTLIRLLIFSLGVFVAFRTESRGQAIAILGVAAIVYPIANQANNVKGAFLTLLGAAIFGLIFYYMLQNLELFRWRQDRIEYAVLGRQEMWAYLLTHWLLSGGNPLIAGFGACASFEIIGFYPHNLPVEIVAEYGLIGVILFGSILGRSLYNCLDLLTRVGNSESLRCQAVTIIGLCGVTFALTLKEGSLYTWPILFFYLICLEQQALIARQTNNSTGNWKAMFVRQAENDINQNGDRLDGELSPVSWQPNRTMPGNRFE